MGHHHSFNRVRLTFSIAMAAIEQRYVTKFFDAKKFALDRIVAELASAHGEQTYVKKRWILDPPSKVGKIRYGGRSQAWLPAA
jgi:hypothetical protein